MEGILVSTLAGRGAPHLQEVGMMRRMISFLCVLALMFALAPAASATQGTMVITVDTTLTEDHDGNIVIDADDVTLDCAGFTITGNGQEIGIAVQGYTGVTIQNCLVTESSWGIVIHGFSNILLGNSTYANALTGVALSGAANTVDASRSDDNGDAGYRVWDSSATSLTNNRATGNAGAGFVCERSQDVRLVGNVVRYGGYWVNDCDGRLIRNEARDNLDQGFVLEHVTGMRLIENLSRGNENGFLLFHRSSHITMRGNRAIGNEFDGFFLKNSDRSVLKQNTARANGVYGFGLQSSSHNTLMRNTACRNAVFDAYDDGSGVGNVWRANDFCTKDI